MKTIWVWGESIKILLVGLFNPLDWCQQQQKTGVEDLCRQVWVLSTADTWICRYKEWSYTICQQSLTLVDSCDSVCRQALMVVDSRLIENWVYAVCRQALLGCWLVTNFWQFPNRILISFWYDFRVVSFFFPLCGLSVYIKKDIVPLIVT